MSAMTALAPYEADVDPRQVPVDVEIVVPVYNEAAQLAERVGPNCGGSSTSRSRSVPS